MMCCHAGVTMRGHVTCHVMDRDVTHYPTRPDPTRPYLLTSVGGSGGQSNSKRHLAIARDADDWGLEASR